MSVEHNRTDKRQHARFEILDYALMHSVDNGAPSGTRAVIVDVSLGGFQLRSKSKFEAQNLYHLVIGRCDGSPINVTAEARYSVSIEGTDLYATGFKIRPEDNAQRIDWVDYVHSVFQSQGESLTF